MTDEHLVMATTKTRDYAFREVKEGDTLPEHLHLIASWKLRPDRISGAAAVRAMEIYWQLDSEIREEYRRRTHEQLPEDHVLWRAEDTLRVRVSEAIEEYKHHDQR